MTEELFLQRYQQLNPQQKQAVDIIDGPLLVVAGPGAGKTELLSLRVANILRQRPEILPTNILCLTYTEAGATNMRQRLSGLIGHQAYKVNINTFHGFCNEIINRHGQYFYQGATLQLADDLAKYEIMEQAFATLSHKDPLAGFFQESYTYLKDAHQAIGYLKQAGLTPDQCSELFDVNEVLLSQVSDRITSAFQGARVDVKFIPVATEIAEYLAAISQADPATTSPSLGQRGNILQYMHQSLQIAIDQAQAIGKGTPIGEWRKKHLVKDDHKQYQLKDLQDLPKLRSLVEIYRHYQEAMAKNHYFDYDDMILDVLQALSSNDTLRNAIQEQYHYILVDEFQDTNDAQLSLLDHISDAIVHEGRPNIMVVGDDDQAIYKFQGASIDNINRFHQAYQQPSLVVLTHNYRSSQHILDLSRQVITQGQIRLENINSRIIKELKAAGQHADLAVKPALHLYQTKEQEYLQIAQSIHQRLEQDGSESANTIAIIARRHSDLSEISRYLELYGLPVRYDKQHDVLNQPHIYQLVQMARFISLLANHQQAEADELLPEILSYPFWGIDRQTLWHISIAASQATEPQEKLWLWQMEASSHPQLRTISDWFKQLRLEAFSLTVEELLERLIGGHTPLVPIDEDAEDDQAWLDAQAPISGFTSPFKEHYFPKPAGNQQSSPAQYVDFLSNLQVFVQALREYRPNQNITLADLLTFVDLHQRSQIKLLNTTVYTTKANAVQLMTAHSAKGLEFDTVYVLSCDDKIWNGSGRSSMINFPKNLLIAPEGDNTDDHLRLFFVALTRAKKELILSTHLYSHDGKDRNRLQFLVELIDGQQIEVQTTPSQSIDQSIVDSWRTYHHPPISSSEQDRLLPLVEDYKLSLTHLNDFLDVSRGGPQTVLEQHLLRFPQPKSSAQDYGSAVHESLRHLFDQFQQTGVLPSVESLLENFAHQLQRQRVSGQELDKLMERGREDLSLYYESRSSHFSSQDIIEQSFAYQGVMVGQAALSGKIDRIVKLDDAHLEVYDIKTGKPALSWDGRDDNQKIKLDKYRRQLLFYKVLVENSREYGGQQTVTRGALEFITPYQGKFAHLPLSLAELDHEVDTLKQLIQVVYQHITTLNFPDTSGYKPTYSGMQQFIADLLEQKI